MINELKDTENIKKIVDNNLCSSCGVCKAVCPFGAISFEWNQDSKKPVIDFDKCTNCSSCYAVCPGKDIAFQNEEKTLIGKELGKIDTSFLIKKITEEKYVASSGFVTSFLKYLFETKKIGGALVVSLEGGDLKNAKSKIIKGVDDLEKIKGSVYCQVPLSDALTELESLKGNFVVVGLPCQIRGINNLIMFKKSIREKIILKIGLFCGYMVGYTGMDYLLKSLKIPDSKKIIKISFRAKKGKEDGFLVETEDKDYFISKQKYTSLLNRSFSNKRCLMCNDMSSEFADISCGDAHGYPGKQSLVLSRNEKSTRLINEAIEKGYINLNKKLTIEESYESQMLILKYKKNTIRSRLKIMERFNGIVPGYEPKFLPKNNIFQKIGSFFYILNCYITDGKKGRSLFFFLPNKIIIFFNHVLTYLLAGKPFNVLSDIRKKYRKGDNN